MQLFLLAAKWRFHPSLPAPSRMKLSRKICGKVQVWSYLSMQEHTVNKRIWDAPNYERFKVLVLNKQYLEWTMRCWKYNHHPRCWIERRFPFGFMGSLQFFPANKIKTKLQAPCLTQHGMTWSNNFSYFPFLVLVKIWHTQYYKCNKWM
jgi:hypothetical protein